MSHQNIEIKARCADVSFIRQFLIDHMAESKGTDLQTDTYFKVGNGRLKLREGNIENALIFYNRENIAGPKMSQVNLFQVNEDSDMLKQILINANGIKVVVKKKREIWFIDNVKFHIDEVEGLGSFVEIEAIDKDGSLGLEKIQEQCDHYLHQFNITEENLLTHSYSDLLMNAS